MSLRLIKINVNTFYIHQQKETNIRLRAITPFILIANIKIKGAQGRR